MVRKNNLSNYELLIRIDERVNEIRKEMTELCKGINKNSQRITKLEEWRMYLLGAAAAGGAIASLFVDKIRAVFR